LQGIGRPRSLFDFEYTGAATKKADGIWISAAAVASIPETTCLQTAVYNRRAELIIGCITAGHTVYNLIRTSGTYANPAFISDIGKVLDTGTLVGSIRVTLRAATLIDRAVARFIGLLYTIAADGLTVVVCVGVRSGWAATIPGDGCRYGWPGANRVAVTRAAGKKLGRARIAVVFAFRRADQVGA